MFAAIYVYQRAVYPKGIIGAQEVNHFGYIVRLGNTPQWITFVADGDQFFAVWNHL